LQEKLIQQPEPGDVEKNKVMGILAYIFFLIPVLAARESKFAMYHANQGLLLFLAGLIINISLSAIHFFSWYIVRELISLLIIALAIVGIINASRGEMKPLPLIGGINILK